jgi:putative membrane protein
MSDLNDPRVLFAAERTLLAWNRTSISLMAFGFVVERFGLFIQLVARDETRVVQRHISFFVGLLFILLAAFTALYSIWQFNKFLKTLKPKEIPTGYKLQVGMVVNGLIGFLSIVLALYLVLSFLFLMI